MRPPPIVVPLDALAQALGIPPGPLTQLVALVAPIRAVRLVDGRGVVPAVVLPPRAARLLEAPRRPRDRIASIVRWLDAQSHSHQHSEIPS